MDTRAAELIASLDLAPHPEGGFFRELYRSDSRVQPLDGRPERRALTTIYVLLPAGEVSRWHRVGSDEVWHFFEGDPLELFTIDASSAAFRSFRSRCSWIAFESDDAPSSAAVSSVNGFSGMRVSVVI